MAESGMTRERAVLEATRSRLEAALSEDENWRALKQLRAQATGEQGAPGRLRDARLELLLMSNPLFRAWKHVDDAIEDLRRNDSLSNRLSGSGTRAPAHVLASGSSAKEVASLADLSRGIARLIQRGMPEADPGPVQAAEADDDTQSAAQQAKETRPVTAEAKPEAALTQQPLATASVEPARAAEVKVAVSARSAAREPERTARNVDQPRTDMRPKAPERDEPPFPPGVEAEEATVTFVTRELVSSRSPAMASADLAPDHQAVPAGWSPTRVIVNADDIMDSLCTPNRLVEEAEVTILTEEAIKQRQETAQRDGNLRRFRKALLGD